MRPAGRTDGDVQPTVTSAATGTTTATPTATVSPSAAGTVPASAAWTLYTTADGQLTFEHPAVWSVREPAGGLPEGGGAFAEVTNQAGKPLATLRTNMATGSTCLERFPYAVLESEELPLLAQGGAAPYLEQAKKYAATPEYKDIKRMITSLRPAG
nr:hypothetical protein [Pseudarthrobacter psychrotolerans]